MVFIFVTIDFVYLPCMIRSYHDPTIIFPSLEMIIWIMWANPTRHKL